jgi:hypothetical protein
VPMPRLLAATLLTATLVLGTGFGPAGIATAEFDRAGFHECMDHAKNTNYRWPGGGFWGAEMWCCQWNGGFVNPDNGHCRPEMPVETATLSPNAPSVRGTHTLDTPPEVLTPNPALQEGPISPAPVG